MIEMDLYIPLDCEEILRTLLPMIWSVRYLKISISRAVSNYTAEGRGSATLGEKLALCENLGYLLKTKVCHSQVHDYCKDSKG